jgi:hypothetical protein
MISMGRARLNSKRILDFGKDINGKTESEEYELTERKQVGVSIDKKAISESTRNGFATSISLGFRSVLYQLSISYIQWWPYVSVGLDMQNEALIYCK